eukprot:symbB.v1.2.009492.t1/scaffold590.1/size183855/4
MELEEALGSPWVLHQWLQNELLHWQEEHCSCSLENARLIQEHSEWPSQRSFECEAHENREGSAIRWEIDWCNELINTLMQLHSSKIVDDKARVIRIEQLAGEVEDATGAASREVVAERWAALVTGKSRKLRKDQEEEVQAHVVSKANEKREILREMKGAKRHLSSLSHESRGRVGTGDEVRKKLKEAEARLLKEKNAVIMTKDAIWACHQQDIAAKICLLRQRHQKLHSEEAELEEEVQRLRQSSSVNEDDLVRTSAMEEKAAAETAEDIAEAGQRQLQEQLRSGSHTLEEREAKVAQILASRATEEEEHANWHRRVQQNLKSEARNAEQASVAAQSLATRRDEINAECHDLREQAISHISETRLLEEKRAEILEETAVEKQRGRTWETKLRQAGSETRELRKVLDEEETKCKERIAIEKQRGRHSLEWSGLQQALARVSMVSDSQSLRESMLMRTSSRQGKLTEELRTAEALHHDIKGQVSEMRAELKELQVHRSVEAGVSGAAEEAGQLRHWRLQQERKAALRLQGMVRRFGAQASVTNSTLAVSDSESEGQIEQVPTGTPDGLDSDRINSIPEFLKMKAEETRLAIRHGEIRAAKLAAARQMAGSPLMLHDLRSES